MRGPTKNSKSKKDSEWSVNKKSVGQQRKDTGQGFAEVFVSKTGENKTISLLQYLITGQQVLGAAQFIRLENYLVI